jgi:tetratricopeptide (TPR) repeat protein
MSVKSQIKLLLREAEIYRSQGLLIEAKGKYNDAIDRIGKLDQAKNKEELVQAITRKIKSLTISYHQIERAQEAPKMPPKVQDLVKNLFSFSHDKDEDKAALEGAITLAKFGQYDRALEEFTELTKRDSLRVVACKNILRCCISVYSPEEAVERFKKWLKDDLYSTEQLQKIRLFLEDLLEKRGTEVQLPMVPDADDDAVDENRMDEDLIDISSIGITFESGPQKGRMVEMEVSFQSGNMISLIVSSKDRALIENLKVGFRLNDVQFFSPIAIFQGSGIVMAKTKINSGPKRGDYSLDIKIVST